MKIKKHGKEFKSKVKAKTEEFKCEDCGCEFTAKEDEYYRDEGGAESSGGYYGTTAITISYTRKDYLVCSCPECHKIVKKIEERETAHSIYCGSSVTPCGTTTVTNKLDVPSTLTVEA